jgi:hypothetical protein
MVKKEAVLLFSGGRDSFLSAIKLVEGGFKVHLVNFKNGWVYGGDNAKIEAERLIKKYGKDKIAYLGSKNVSIFFREFFLPYFNMTPSEIKKEYGEIPISQFNCLACRASMYIWSIIKAKQMGIKFIAEGARRNQGFVIQLPIMIEEFKKLLSTYNLELLLPVYELKSDWERKSLLLFREFVPKTFEPQCLLGVPLPDNKEPSREIQVAVKNFFNKSILGKSNRIINEYLNSEILIG